MKNTPEKLKAKSKSKISYYLLIIILFFFASFSIKLFTNNWNFFRNYLLISFVSSYFLGRLLNYLKKKSKKKFDEIVGFGSISSSEIILGNILLVYPSYLTLFYSSKVVGSLIIGIGADSIKRKYVLLGTLVILSIFSFTSFNSNTIESMIPFILPASLMAIGFFGDSSIAGRIILLDAHVHEISNSQEKRRLLMAKSVEFESLVWIYIGVISYTFNLPVEWFLIIGVFLNLILIILSKYVKDQTHPEKGHKGIKGLFKELKILKLIGIILPLLTLYILIVETSFFSIFFNSERTLSTLFDKSISTMSWAIPMYLGCLLHQNILKNAKEYTLITTGIFIFLIGILIYIINYFITHDFSIKLYYLVSFGISGLGSGIFLPCFYSVTTSFKGIHFFGFLIGTVDSIRTLGEWLGSLTVKINSKSIILLYSTFVILLLISISLFRKLLKNRNENKV